MSIPGVKQKLFLTLIGFILIVGLGCQASQSQVAQTRAVPQGRYLLALSDVDMVATVYEDGNLGVAVPNTQDTLYTRYLSDRKTSIEQQCQAQCNNYRI